MHMRNTPEEQRSAWASYVRALRAATGMSTKAFAERLATNPATIWRWETAKTKPESPAVPERIAQLFSVDLGEVLEAAGLKPSDETPTEPTRERDDELEDILTSNLPQRIKQELIETLLEERERDKQRRREHMQRLIRAEQRRAG
jgi:transcriptional regulator with XRE-family HTH domain